MDTTSGFIILIVIGIFAFEFISKQIKKSNTCPKCGRQGTWSVAGREVAGQHMRNSYTTQTTKILDSKGTEIGRTETPSHHVEVVNDYTVLRRCSACGHTSTSQTSSPF